MSELADSISFEDAIKRGFKMAENLKPGVNLQWWPTIDRQLFGLRPHELTLLCAPTGSGKTELLANIVTQMLLRKTKFFVAPVETGPEDFALRVAGCLMGQNLANGEPIPPEVTEKFLAVHLNTISDSVSQVATYDNRVDVEEMITMMEYHSASRGVKVCLLDNLNFFLKPTSAANQLIEMDGAIHALVMAAKRLPMHTILVVHPKKTDGGRVESEFDIKGSSTAVQEAANVLLFNRPKPEDVAAKFNTWFDREIVFKKLRKRGSHVNQPVWVTWANGKYMEKPKKVEVQTNDVQRGTRRDFKNIRPRGR